MLLIKITCTEHRKFLLQLEFDPLSKKACMFKMQKKQKRFIFRRMYNLVSLICQLNMQTVKVNQRQT